MAHLVSGNENLISFEANSMPAMQWSQPARSQVENGAVFEPSVRTTCRYDHNFCFYGNRAARSLLGRSDLNFGRVLSL